MKEFTIRATDMSEASQAAFMAAGLNAEEMAAAFVAGGDDARAALGELARGLLKIEDPVEQANQAIALFGTPLEDLSINEIPDFLDQLTFLGEGMADVEGASDRMSDTLNDNLATKLESIKRTGLQRLTEFMEGAVGGAERIADAFGEDGLGGVFDLVAPAVEDAFNDAVDFVEEGLPKWTKQLTEWGEAAVSWLADATPDMLREAGKMLGALGSWMIDDGLPLLVEKLTQWGSAFLKWIGPLIPPMIGELGKLLLELTRWIVVDAVPKIASALNEWKNAFFEWITDTEEGLPAELGELTDEFVDWAEGLADDIAAALVNSKPFKRLVENFREALRGILDTYNSLPFPDVKIPDALRTPEQPLLSGPAIDILRTRPTEDPGVGTTFNPSQFDDPLFNPTDLITAGSAGQVSYSITVNNPTGEPTEESIARELDRSRHLTGAN